MSAYMKPNSRLAPRTPSGCARPNITATSAMKPRPAVMPSTNWVTSEIDSCAPARPHRTPVAEDRARSAARRTRIPTEAAAAGASPTARRPQPDPVAEQQHLERRRPARTRGRPAASSPDRSGPRIGMSVDERRCGCRAGRAWSGRRSCPGRRRPARIRYVVTPSASRLSASPATIASPPRSTTTIAKTSDRRTARQRPRARGRRRVAGPGRARRRRRTRPTSISPSSATLKMPARSRQHAAERGEQDRRDEPDRRGEQGDVEDGERGRPSARSPSRAAGRQRPQDRAGSRRRG